MMNIVKRLSGLYWRYLKSREQYARHIGVQIGENCLIGIRDWSTEPYLIHIGNNVQITSDVHFYTHGGGNCIRKLYPNFDVFGKIVIEDWAYIGSGSHLLPGVTIGEGALVAAGSVVTKSVPSYTVVAGNPARVISTTQEYLEKNLPYNVNTKGKSEEEKKCILLSLKEELFIKK